MAKRLTKLPRAKGFASCSAGDVVSTHAAGVIGNDPGNQPGSAGSIPARRSTEPTKLRVVNATIAEANAFILAFHRHHLDMPSGIGRYALAAVNPADGLVHGVAILGLPAALNRMTDKSVLEVSRLASDGHPNVCSVLYSACARAARALGFRQIITYILDSETGGSLKAAGWTEEQGLWGGMPWSNRPGRRDAHPVGPKGRWRLDLRAEVPIAWPDECRTQESVTQLIFEWGKTAEDLG